MKTFASAVCVFALLVCLPPAQAQYCVGGVCYPSASAAFGGGPSYGGGYGTMGYSMPLSYASYSTPMSYSAPSYSEPSYSAGCSAPMGYSGSCSAPRGYSVPSYSEPSSYSIPAAPAVDDGYDVSPFAAREVRMVRRAPVRVVRAPVQRAPVRIVQRQPVRTEQRSTSQIRTVSKTKARTRTAGRVGCGCGNEACLCGPNCDCNPESRNLCSSKRSRSSVVSRSASSAR